MALLSKSQKMYLSVANAWSLAIYPGQDTVQMDSKEKGQRVNAEALLNALEGVCDTLREHLNDVESGTAGTSEWNGKAWKRDASLPRKEASSNAYRPAKGQRTDDAKVGLNLYGTVGETNE